MKQGIVVMDAVLRYASLCVIIASLVDALDFVWPHRKEPVLGKTYFGSNQLLSSKNPTMHAFRSIFTLPQGGVEAKGTFSQIYEQLDYNNKIGNTLNPLVIKIQESWSIPYYEFQLYMHQFAQNLTRIHVEDVQELWIIMESMPQFPNATNFNVFNEHFYKLTSFHLISLMEHSIIFPRSIMNLLPQIQILDLQSSCALVHAKSEAIIPTFDCVNQRTCFDFQEYLSIMLQTDFNECCSSMEILSIRRSPGLYLPSTEIKLTHRETKRKPHYGIRCLCLSANYFRDETLTGIPVFLPNLEMLDVSHNLELVTDQHGNKFLTFALENLLFHPSLQAFISTNELRSRDSQYYFQLHNRLQSKFDKINLSAMEYSSFWEKFKGRNCTSNLNATILLDSYEMQCRTIKCLLELDTLPCDKYYIKFNRDCAFGILQPVSPKLQEIYMGNILYIDYGLDYVLSTSGSHLLYAFGWMLQEQNYQNAIEKNYCFDTNSLTKVDLSFHSFDDFFLEQSYPFIYLKHGSVGLNKLNELNMNYVTIGDKYIFNLFRFGLLPKLKYVYLRGNSLILPSDLQLCVKLHYLAVIDFSDNSIEILPPYLLKSCNKLESINLSQNKIKILPVEIHQAIEHMDALVDLTNNHLSCECHDNALETLNWLQKHHYKYIDFDKYTCFGQGKTKLISNIKFDTHQDNCQGWLIKDIIMLCTFTNVLAIFFALIVSLTYKYRYRLVMKIYQFKRCLQNCSRQKSRQQRFMFDLFVSYCNEDRHWVHNVLLPQIEYIHGIHCCIHYRDFPAHGTVSQVIHKYMGASRYIVIVFSQYSVQKKWPHFEFERAQELQRREGKKVIYVKLGNLGNNITREIAEVLDSEIYLTWPEDVKNERKIQHFFDKLVAAIRGEQLCGTCCSGFNASSRNMPPFDDQDVEMFSGLYDTNAANK